MSLKSFAAKLFASYVSGKIKRWSSNPLETQNKVFNHLIKTAANTAFGKDHDFNSIRSHADFTKRVPIRDYEQLRSYVDQVVAGAPDILWPGKPLYFAKTSGTTSGAKYIPLTKESMPTHIAAARNSILCYIAETGKASFVDGKMIFLQGSPEMNYQNGIGLGRLSGIVANYVPGYLQKNRLPSWETNCIENWEDKVDAIVAETIDKDMRMISGIPPWVQMYFERLINKANKPIGELFKNFELFIYGGVNFEPYRAIFAKLIGRTIPSIELYPASEGFFAFQDSQKEPGMLLQLNSGIFYEFVKAENFFDDDPERILLDKVVIDQNYVMLISTTAGLWAYNIGDTIQFTSTSPYRVIVSGRIKHFISAFGEHVIGKEVENALNNAINNQEILVNEFTVAPQVQPENGRLPYHEWFIEFEENPRSTDELALSIDSYLRKQNSYYDDLITGKILEPLHITTIQKGGFQKYMKSVGKLGGQNKLPRLANDRKIADQLQPFILF